MNNQQPPFQEHAPWKYLGIIRRRGETRERLHDRVTLLLMNYGFDLRGRTKIIPYDSEYNLLQDAYIRPAAPHQNLPRATATFRYIPLCVTPEEKFFPNILLPNIIFTRPTMSGGCDATITFAHLPLEEEVLFLKHLRSLPYQKINKPTYTLKKEPER